MRYFSTFSGIGGFELGIQKAIANKIKPEKQSTECPVSELGSSTDTPNSDGNWWGSSATCVGYSEIDKYAIKVYERNFNGDIRCLQPKSDEVKQDSNDITNELQQRELPNNNRRHKNYGDITTINADTLPDFDCLVGGFPCQAFSIAGKRKGFDDTRGTLFFDLARILRAKQPRLFVFENVKGLLSHDSGRTFKTIISTIDELGYDCQWQVLNSKNHGVPQNRERVIIVGHLRGTSRPKVFPIGNSNTETSEKSLIKSLYHNDGYRTANETLDPDGISTTLNTARGGGHIPCVPVLTPDRLNKRQNGRRFKEDGEPSFTLNTQDRHGIYDGMKIRRLTPVECERLQGFPDNWTKYGIGDEPISDSQRYKMCGNAVTTNVIQAVFEGIFTQSSNKSKEALEKEIIL